MLTEAGRFISSPGVQLPAAASASSIQGNQGAKTKEQTRHQQVPEASPQSASQALNCDKMKVAVVFVLLFATILCQPVRKVSLSSSESSEELARRPAPPAMKKQALLAPQTRAGPAQSVAAAAESDESTESSDEDESDSVDTTSSPDTASDNSKDSDEDDDDDETEENETEEDESSDSSDSESGEASTASPTDVPVVVTGEPTVETTVEPIEPTVEPIQPTIVTDTDGGRGDSLGYPSDYKSIIYVEDKSYHKAPSTYKSYEYMGKKTAYDMPHGNDVEKSLKVYKVQALQVHSDLLEEDTSTPEVESQGLDTRQATLPEEEESVAATEATTSESSSTPEEEEEEEEESTSTAADSASASQESEDEESQSSEEATATPGAADDDDSDESKSSEGDSEEDAAAPDATTDMPVVITAK